MHRGRVLINTYMKGFYLPSQAADQLVGLGYYSLPRRAGPGRTTEAVFEAKKHGFDVTRDGAPQKCR